MRSQLFNRKSMLSLHRRRRRRRRRRCRRRRRHRRRCTDLFTTKISSKFSKFHEIFDDFKSCRFSHARRS